MHALLHYWYCLQQQRVVLQAVHFAHMVEGLMMALAAALLLFAAAGHVQCWLPFRQRHEHGLGLLG